MKFTIRRKLDPSDPPAGPEEFETGGKVIVGGGLVFLIIVILLVILWIASLVKLARNWNAYGNMAVVWLLLIFFIGPFASIVFLFVPTPKSKGESMTKSKKKK